MKKFPEIIPATKSKKLDLYIFIATYCLLLILIEPAVNYLLLLDVNSSDVILINDLNAKKIVITEIAYAVLRMIPIFWLAWLGYRIITSAQLPPARMSLPFAVPSQKGRAAKKTGLYIMSLSLLLLAQNIVFTIRQITN